MNYLVPTYNSEIARIVIEFWIAIAAIVKKCELTKVWCISVTTILNGLLIKRFLKPRRYARDMLRFHYFPTIIWWKTRFPSKISSVPCYFIGLDWWKNISNAFQLIIWSAEVNVFENAENFISFTRIFHLKFSCLHRNNIRKLLLTLRQLFEVSIFSDHPS